MPDPATTALTAAQHCAAVAALNLDIAAAHALMENYRAAGNAEGAEGCRQTINKATEAITEHLLFFREAVKP